MTALDPQEALRSGDIDGCRAALTEQIKAEPGDIKLRAFLAQLLMVEGNWDRAGKQLDMIASLDATAIDLVTDYRAALASEAARLEVMAGKRAPSIMGAPSEWIAKLVEALRLDAAGAGQAAYDLRAEAFDAAPMSSGEVDGTKFEWLSDADQRFGPVLEATMNGEYHWIPFETIVSIDFEPPKDLRDLVWTVGIITLTNGGEWPILVPTRYPNSDTQSGAEAGHALAKRTDWGVLHEDHYAGTGQRMLTSNEADLPLLDIRSIAFDREVASSPDIDASLTDGG